MACGSTGIWPYAAHARQVILDKAKETGEKQRFTKHHKLLARGSARHLVPSSPSLSLSSSPSGLLTAAAALC